MELKEALGKIFKAAKEKYNIKSTPKVTLKEDEENLKRMEVVGQNGNTGIHYEEIKEKTTWFAL